MQGLGDFAQSISKDERPGRVMGNAKCRFGNRRPPWMGILACLCCSGVSLVCSTEDGGGVRLNESELNPSEMDSLGWAPPQNMKKEA